ncbi:hypothetical protein [Aquiflexum sp.]|uniref:hypothetical protein n=1 Tax=Aquiflexum sp. TaxID=1872584 RepID=UPI00359316AD
MFRKGMTSSYLLGSRHPEARRISRGSIYVYLTFLILVRCPESIGAGFLHELSGSA